MVQQLAQDDDRGYVGVVANTLSLKRNLSLLQSDIH